MITNKFSDQEISGVPLACLRLRYELSVEIPSNLQEECPLFHGDSFTLVDGMATLAAHPLCSAHLSRTGVHWNESVPGKGFWSGVFRFSPDRLWFRGFLHYGPNAANLTRYEVMGLVRNHDFSLETASGKRSVLSIGYARGSVRTAPHQHIELDGFDITNRATLEHIPGSGLSLRIGKRRNRGHAPDDWLSSGSMNLDLGFSKGMGVIHVNNPTQTQSFPECWSATGSTAVAFDHPTPVPGPGDPDSLTVNILAQCDLSGAEAQSQSLIRQNLLWSIEQNWVDAFFPSQNNQPSRPDLAGQIARMTVVDQDCEWYNFRFAPAYLGLAIEDASPTLSPSDKLKLQYYLASQICLEAAYTRQTGAIATMAAIQASSTLAQFVNDTTHAPNYWGQALYTYLTAPAQLSSLINTINSNPEPGMAQLDDYATLLTVFDETGELASNYYNQVLLALTALLSLDADASQDPDMPVWLPDYLGAFIQNYFTGKVRPSDPGGAAAFDIAEEIYYASQAAGSLGQLGTQFWTTLRTAQGAGMAEQARAIAQGPSRLTRSAYTILLALGLIASIYALTNWDSLPAATQAAAVVNLAGVVYSVIVILPDISQLAAYTASVFASRCQQALTASEALGGLEALENTLLIARPTLTQKLFEWLSSKFSSATRTLSLTGTRIATLFGTTKAQVVIRGVGGVFAAASFAVSVWILVNDIQTGTGVVGAINIAFDAVQVALSLVMLACAIGTLIPIVDIVTSIVGIAAAAVSALLAIAQTLFNWFTQPPSPAELYMSGPVANLLQTLPTPPAGWTPPAAAQPA